MQCNKMQYSTIQYSTIQYNTIQYNTIQCIHATDFARKYEFRALSITNHVHNPVVFKVYSFVLKKQDLMKLSVTPITFWCSTEFIGPIPSLIIPPPTPLAKFDMALLLIKIYGPNYFPYPSHIMKTRKEKKRGSITCRTDRVNEANMDQ